jgi:hypothetical protein
MNIKIIQLLDAIALKTNFGTVHVKYPVLKI